MIIKFNGSMTVDQLSTHIKQITSDIQKRAGIDRCDISVKDVQVGVLFHTQAGEEPQYLTITHDDVPEVFQVNVKLDDNGNIVRSVDNEKESFYDDYTRAINKGEDSPCITEIESVFMDEDLEQLDVVDAGDLKEIRYSVKDSDDIVIRYYRNGILVGEAFLKSKQDD